mmetsp:Transcript_385/g.486  ORF Transcript_385/g.486 Transcript_385/m.486 type:complete len:166 (-) Transcript_385:63-560(-)
MQGIFFFVFLSALFASVICLQPTIKVRSDSSDDVFLLSLQQCNSSSPWTLHGLWPQWGTCCAAAPFNEKSIQSLIPMMDKLWPSCPQYHNTNEGLWSHEWQKHGSCSGLTEYEYFSTAMNLTLTYRHWCPTPEKGECKVCFNKPLTQPIHLSSCETGGSFPNCPN